MDRAGTNPGAGNVLKDDLIRERDRPPVTMTAWFRLPRIRCARTFHLASLR